MKDRYVGDQTDYLKYALLRRLQGVRKGSLAMCWMLTEDDHGRDGNQLKYLERPAKYREVDPGLFDALESLVRRGRRSVRDVASTDILSRARFVDWKLSDDIDERLQYFEIVQEIAPPGSLLFFDPDNGLEVKKPKGHKDSNKYIYWDEIERYAPDRSLVIFQHWRREKKAKTINDAFSRLEAHLPNHEAFALAGPRVLLLIAALPAEAKSLLTATRQVEDAWPTPIAVHTGPDQAT